MVDIDQVISKRRIIYEGLFSFPELYKLIDEYFEELGYDKSERRMTESIREKGKFVEMHMDPYKFMTDYLRFRIHIKIVGENIKEVEIEKEGRKIRLNKGKVILIFDAYLESDYEQRWEDKPLYYFLRVLYNKFFITSYISTHKNELNKHCTDLMDSVKGFLNLYRY